MGFHGCGNTAVAKAVVFVDNADLHGFTELNDFFPRAPVTLACVACFISLRISETIRVQISSCVPRNEYYILIG